MFRSHDILLFAKRYSYPMPVTSIVDASDLNSLSGEKTLCNNPAFTGSLSFSIRTQLLPDLKIPIHYSINSKLFHSAPFSIYYECRLRMDFDAAPPLTTDEGPTTRDPHSPSLPLSPPHTCPANTPPDPSLLTPPTLRTYSSTCARWPTGTKSNESPATAPRLDPRRPTNMIKHRQPRQVKPPLRPVPPSFGKLHELDPVAVGVRKIAGDTPRRDHRQRVDDPGAVLRQPPVDGLDIIHLDG